MGRPTAAAAHRSAGSSTAAQTMVALPAQWLGFASVLLKEPLHRRQWAIARVVRFFLPFFVSGLCPVMLTGDEAAQLNWLAGEKKQRNVGKGGEGGEGGGEVCN